MLFMKHFNLLTCFRNEINCGPFNGKLNSFSLDTKRMKMNPEYKDVELQLEFLNAEVKEEKCTISPLCSC